MAPNKQKMVTSARSAPRRGRPAKPKQNSLAPLKASAPGEKGPKLKINFKRTAAGPGERDKPAYQFPFSAPGSAGLTAEGGYDGGAAVEEGQGVRRGARTRRAPQEEVVVYGSEMENLFASSATVGETEDAGEESGRGLSPAILALPTPSSPTIEATTPPPHLPVSQDVHDILSSLQSTPEIQVDLPNMWRNEAAGEAKPYTSAFLTALYTQAYASSLWHICDLIADTWIRALQAADQQSHRSSDKKTHLWRANKALEARFRKGQLGFKQDVETLDLQVEDPELAPDVGRILPETLRDVYAHTLPQAGVRLLWADAAALAGRAVESEVSRRPGLWPAEAAHDVMCSALRMVGRKLTLKIEERYEGAWCRYHEHARRGLPCYRRLAALQGGADADAGAKGEGVGKRKRGAGGEGEAKRVRFGGRVGSVGGDVDAEG